MDDFHNKPFDETTQKKLKIIRGYVRKWLPVFITKPNDNKYFENVAIFDFFSGPGTDSEGNPGSPLIIIEEIKNYLECHRHLFNHNIKFFLFLNDSNPTKIHILEKKIKEQTDPTLPCNIDLKISNESFVDCYNRNRDFIHSNKTACLLLVDQFGVKEMTPEIFKDISSAPTTDLIFFYASHFIKRFCKTEIGQKILRINPEIVQKTPENQIHQLVCNYYRELLDESNRYYLAPFTLKKITNVYGLIFGTHNLFGLEKFLEVAWSVDPLNGEANTDIYDDRPDAPSLFDIFNTPTKLRIFQQELLEYLQEERTNIDLFEFTLFHGFLGKHCINFLKELNKDFKLDVTSLREGIKKNTFYISKSSYNPTQPSIKLKLKQRSNG